jgi:hypothetical protein
LYCFFEFLVQS